VFLAISPPSPVKHALIDGDDVFGSNPEWVLQAEFVDLSQGESVIEGVVACNGCAVNGFDTLGRFRQLETWN